MHGRPGSALDRADRLYARLLWLLPVDFRREYGTAMRQTFADLCASRMDARSRGLTSILAYGLADLVGGATREWTATLFSRDRWHRSAASGLCLLAGLLVVYSQVRYPANLLRIDDVVQHLLLLVVLAVLADGFTGTAAVSALTVGCALASLPGWLAETRFPLVAFGYVAALILIATLSTGRRDGRRYAALRAGLSSGALAGVTALAVSVTAAMLTMSGLRHDAANPGGYLRSGQPNPGAYLIGTRICSGSIHLLACVAIGALLGLAASVPARRHLPTASRPSVHL
jgi:hypothetical protein